MTETTYWTRRPLSRRGMIRAGGLAGAGLAGAALIGCGDDDEDPPPAAATPAAPGTTPAATPDADGDGPRSGGTLGMMNAIPQAHFNPITNPAGSEITLSVTHVYDMMFTPRLDDRVMVLEAAESAELVDETTLVVTLKDGLVYQDRPPVNGRPVSSEDIAVMQDYITNEEAAGDRSFQDLLLDSTETPDDQTIVFNLRQPSAYLFTGTQLGAGFHGLIVPRELTEGDLAGTEPVGSGPYMLDDYQLEVRYEYVKSPTYRRAAEGQPYIDRRVRLPMTDNAALEAAFRGEQIHQWIPPSESADRIARDLGERVNVTEFTGLNMVTWNMSAAREQYDDERVREAFYRAFNPDELIDLVADGWAVKATGKIAQGLDAYLLDESDSAEYLRYDEAEARSLLDAAGFDFEHVYEMTTLAGAVNESMLQVFTEQWRRIGVQTRAVVAPAPEWLPNISRTGNYDFVGGVVHPGWDSPQRPMRLHHTNSFTIHQAMGMRDPEIDAMIERTEQIIDRDEQIESIKDLQMELLRRYSHMSYVYTPIQRELLWAHVRDWEFTPTNAVMYRTEAWMDV
jgi:peptide/nickel transport system substrate-binding protein